MVIHMYVNMYGMLLCIYYALHRYHNIHVYIHLYLHAAIPHFTLLHCTSITYLKVNNTLAHGHYSVYMLTVCLYMLCLFVVVFVHYYVW